MEFEEIEDRERERVNVDPDDSDVDPGPTTNPDDNTNLEDSEGEDDTSNPQRVNIPDPDPNSLSSDHTPPPLCHSTHTTRGIPHTQPNEDPKMSLGSRTTTSQSAKQVNSQPTSDPSVGTTNSQTDETEHMAMFLTADAPCLYQEAMTHSDADSWVEAIMEEYQNLQ